MTVDRKKLPSKATMYVLVLITGEPVDGNPKTLAVASMTGTGYLS
jgi:hypothetical protein